MSFASTLASTLRTEGYSATFFSSPANALAAARSKAPDLIKSKAETGELLAAARKQGHDFRVLAKPVHPRDLLARVKDADVSDIIVA
jgi:hypothetical protein